tara:strand:- start:397 stop:2169 length:1773 start_codon:yes stop_codon:yes gene_type:complete
MNKIKQFFKKIEDFLYDLYEFDKHMKKVVLLLLLPVFSFGQLTSSGDGIDVDLVFAGTTADANKPLNKVQVNDTIVVKLQLDNLSQKSITYVHVDVQYNINAYQRVDYTFNVPNGAQTSNGNWSGNGMKWSPNPNYDLNDLWAQWSTQGGSYQQVAGWEVDHVEAVSTSGITGNYATLYFKVKDAGANHNYTDNIIITMARVTDNSSGTEYVFPVGKVRGYDTMAITHIPLEDLDSNIYVKVDANSNLDVTKIGVVVQKNGTPVSNNLYFDAGGEINVTEYITSTTDNYTLDFVTSYSSTEWEALLDNIITISDVTLTLSELGQYGHGNVGNVFTTGIQYSAVDSNDDRDLTPQDAYNLLGHVMGTLDIIPDDGTGIFNNSFKPIKKADYNSWSIYKFQNNVQEPNHSVVHPITVDFNQSSYTENFKFGFIGDANGSHSSPVDGTDASSITARSFNVSLAPVMSYGQQVLADGIINGEWSTALEDGKVVATLRLNSTEVTALQLKIDYDNTILTFDEAVFDTGNTVTNFASETNGRVNLGSIEQNGGEIKTGDIYKVYFTGNVTSPVGLVSIFNTDAANTDGHRLILNLQ